MKKLILLLLIFSSTTFAKSGFGVLIGDPTALSFKHFTGKDAAFDAGLAFGHNEIIVFGDYLKHFPGRLGKHNDFIAALSPYVGVGPIFAFDDGDDHHDHHFIDEDNDDNYSMGGRIPLGVEWMSTDIPVGVSLEVVPGVVILPETDAFVQGGLAVRYYF